MVYQFDRLRPIAQMSYDFQNLKKKKNMILGYISKIIKKKLYYRILKEKVNL